MLVVFNNNRSKRFFVKQFTTLGCASFLPKVLAIDEFISQLGGLEIVPNEFLLFELYNIHVELGGEERKYQSFEEFISFGDLMMRDFTEIDQYLVDARQVNGTSRVESSVISRRNIWSSTARSTTITRASMRNCSRKEKPTAAWPTARWRKE